jgi:hypothetical protein
MALSGNTKAEIGFKKAVGVANTQYSNTRIREFNEESVRTAPSLSSFTIFGEEINKNPLNPNSGNTNIGVGLYYTDNIVEKLRLPLEIDTSTNIGTGQSQAYYAKLPSGYSGRTSTSFSGGTLLKDTLGKLQIVPPLFGNGYDYVLLDTQANFISKVSDIDWYLDPYNGVLFVQSPPPSFDGSNLSPGFIECFIYAGKMLNQVSPTGSTGGNAFISNEAYNPATWSGDTISGATRQSLYNKFQDVDNNFLNYTASTNSNFLNYTASTNSKFNDIYNYTASTNSNFLNYTASTNSKFNDIYNYTASTNSNFLNYTASTNTLINNIQNNYITGSTNTNNNISILSGKTSNNLIFRTFTGFSGINLNIDSSNQTIQVYPDYGTGTTQIARGDHTHRPIDLNYPTFDQPIVSGTSIDFNNELTNIQLASNQEIIITGFTNFKAGKSTLIYVSGQPITETSLNYYTLIGGNFYYGYYIGDATVSGSFPNYTLTFNNNTFNNTVVAQGNVLKIINANSVNNSLSNLTVTTNVPTAQTSTIAVTANSQNFINSGTSVYPIINTSGFTNFTSLNILTNNLIYSNQSIYRILSTNNTGYSFTVNNSVSQPAINIICYNTNNIKFNSNPPSLNLIADGEYIAGSNSLIQITCINSTTFLVSFRNNI